MAPNEFIKGLRQGAKLTQVEVANKLGVARTTYTAIENGQGELSLSEIRKLSELYQIPPGDIVEGRISDSEEINNANLVREEALDFYYAAGEPVEIPREAVPVLNPVKLRNVLLYITEKAGAKPSVGETVLYKLLYFIDFDFYEKAGRSITGLTYIKNHYGPIPAASFSGVIASMVAAGELELTETPYFSHKQKKYLPTVRPDLSGLTAEEIKHIDAELGRLADKTASEFTELSHRDTPWISAKPKGKIDYRMAMYRTDATSVRDTTDEL
jgi:transcriptional regulator with XRE-family HTH domain